MKKQKFKFTEQVHKDLIKLSQELPAMYRKDGNGQPIYKMQVVDGSTIDTLDKDGNKPLPGVKYRAKVLQYENHYEKLVMAFREKGQSGVDEYKNFILVAHKQMMAAADVLREKRSFFGKIKTGIKKIFRVY